jgi:hypothetical protein
MDDVQLKLKTRIAPPRGPRIFSRTIAPAESVLITPDSVTCRFKTPGPMDLESFAAWMKQVNRNTAKIAAAGLGD